MNRTDIKNILYTFYEKINTDKHKKTKNVQYMIRTKRKFNNPLINQNFPKIHSKTVFLSSKISGPFEIES